MRNDPADADTLASASDERAQNMETQAHQDLVDSSLDEREKNEDGQQGPGPENTDDTEDAAEDVTEDLPEELEDSEASYEDQYAESDDEEERESDFQEGDIVTLVRVRFPGNAKSHPFSVGSRKFAYGQKVMAMSDRGMTVGYINSFPYQKVLHKSMLPLRSIARVASEEDIEKQKSFHRSEVKAEQLCINLIEELNLDMTLTHVEFIQFGKKAVFYFTAPQRVDFRELVRLLVKDLKMRIELRQISVRDRTAALGAIGVCGLQTCCSSFLQNYGNVSIKMAKNQNLALIPSKLNGVCGQIKCCVRYEDKVYTEKRKKLPKENSFVKCLNGDIGKVLRLHILLERFEMLTDKGQRRTYTVDQLCDDPTPPEEWSFPKRFDYVVDETKTVIGLVEKAKTAQDDSLEEFWRLRQDHNEEVGQDVPSPQVEDLSASDEEDTGVEDKQEAQKKHQSQDNQNKDSSDRSRSRDGRKGRRRRRRPGGGGGQNQGGQNGGGQSGGQSRSRRGGRSGQRRPKKEQS